MVVKYIVNSIIGNISGDEFVNSKEEGKIDDLHNLQKRSLAEPISSFGHQLITVIYDQNDKMKWIKI